MRNSLIVRLAPLAVLAVTSAVTAAPVTIYNFNGNANDSVGGRNLTLAGTTFSNDIPGGTGQSLAFDGTTSRATYDVLNADALSGNYTVAAYVKYTGVSQTTGGVVRTYFGTRAPGEMSFDAKLIDGNKIHGDIGNGAAWLNTSSDAAFNYALNTWYHVAYSVVSPTAGSAGTFTIYVNGNQVGTGTLPANATPTLLFDANHDIAVGNAGTTGGNSGELFQGLIDDVGLYNTALTQAQVQALLVPEPATFSLLAIAGAALLTRRRNRQA